MASLEIATSVLAGGAAVLMKRSRRPENRKMVHVDQVVVELDDVLELEADRCKHGFHVFEGLDALCLEIARRSDDLSAAVESTLPGNVDNAAGRRGFDHMRIPEWFRYCLWIEKTRHCGLGHGCTPLSLSNVRERC
jgi:hypothetical protein